MARRGSFLAGLIGGALAGAVAGLLLTPKPGKEVREIIREKGGEYINKGEGYVTHLRDRVRQQPSDEEVVEIPEGNGDQQP